MTETTVDCPTLRLRLAEAELALHKLLTGSKAQTVTFGPSKSTTFTPATASDLRRYIGDLKDQLASCCGEGTPAPRAPVRFTF